MEPDLTYANGTRARLHTLRHSAKQWWKKILVTAGGIYAVCILKEPYMIPIYSFSAKECIPLMITYQTDE